MNRATRRSGFCFLLGHKTLEKQIRIVNYDDENVDVTLLLILFLPLGGLLCAAVRSTPSISSASETSPPSLVARVASAASVFTLTWGGGRDLTTTILVRTELVERDEALVRDGAVELVRAVLDLD